MLTYNITHFYIINKANLILRLLLDMTFDIDIETILVRRIFKARTSLTTDYYD